MKILIADNFPVSHVDRLEQLGHQLTIDPTLDENSLVGVIADHEILIVRSTRVTAETMDVASTLKLVIRAGVGTNTIDKFHARGKGINVCNVPDANSIAVAELAMGLIICLDRHLASNVNDLRNGVWNKKKYSKARGLYGQKIGIMGLGAIGLALAERANAFGMEVYAVAKEGRGADTVARMSAANIVEVAGMKQLLSICDIVSLHLPANDQTIGMVNTEFLAQMRQGAMLINTSRGELVDEDALILAMESRDILAGLDVYHNEPGANDDSFDSKVACHPNVCGSHHIGASTEQAQTAVSDGVLKVIEAYQQGNVLNCVND